MKKIILLPIFFILSVIILVSGYLSIFGYETDKFNPVLEKRITSNITNSNINLNKIKIKIDVKNFSFFVTTTNPNIEYYGNEVNINKIDAYINLKSLLIGKPKIDKINISSNEIKANEIKNIIKYQKPSNFKRFFLNDVEDGKITFKIDLNLIDNKIRNYEINGVVKNFFTNAKNLKLKKTSFVYLIKENGGEIDNIRGLINGFQITSGNIKFDNTSSLNIKGNLESDLKLNKIDIDKIISKKILQNFEKFQLNGKIKSIFTLNFDKTLKIIDYQVKASGNIQKSNVKFKKPRKYLLIKNKVNNLSFEKTEFKIDFSKDNKKSFSLAGLYSVNGNLLQKFDFNNLYNSNLHQLSINGDLINEVEIPLINFDSNNKLMSINTEFNIKNNNIDLKKFILKQGKNNININNLLIKNNKLVKFDNILFKTFSDGKLNNDFKVSFNKTIKLEGSKYDASNLTNLLQKDDNSNFLNNITKEISLNIKEVITNSTNNIYNFNLIGNIDKGKFNKIVSKGEFNDGKYLDISLRVDKTSKKKILEIYSDLSKPLLTNYKFFNGLSGGQILIFSSYDNRISNTNLTIENFKVKDAPGLVKLLSLADFGGMVDALSGEGLSFEKLEMTMEKNDQVLNLKELYAIGPSISILMEGYVDSKTGLISLRGTMVPAKTLNKFLSKLPIVGDILIPKEIGEGLFGISFKMKGTPGKIKTSVNPIKTLTPRFIQKALKKPK